MVVTKLKEFVWSSAPLPKKNKKLNNFMKNLSLFELQEVLVACAGPDLCNQWISLRLANKFHHFDTIVNILRHGDRKFVFKAVTLRWLYESPQSIFKDSSFLITKLFPTVSYSCRLKIVNNIGKFMNEEDQADIIFNTVHDEYGFYTAIPILPSCSKQKIETVMTSRFVKLSTRQLLRITSRYPGVAYSILRQYQEEERMRAYPKVMKALIDNDPLQLSHFYIDHYEPLHFRVGRQRTKKLLMSSKELILQNKTKFIDLLNPVEVRRHVTPEEYVEIVKTAMPRDLIDWTTDDNMWIWLKKYSKQTKLDILKKAFVLAYNTEMMKCPEYFSPAVTVLLSEAEREEIVSWKVAGENLFQNYDKFEDSYNSSKDNIYSWTALKPCTRSIPELELILGTEGDTLTRAHLSKCLIMSCYANEDSNSLLRVLKLLKQTSRLDLTEVRNQIFIALAIVVDKLKMTKEHWEIVVQMMQFSHLMDMGNSPLEAKIKLLEKCIVFHLRNEHPVESITTTLLVKLKLEYSETEINLNWKISGLRADEQALISKMFISGLQEIFPLDRSLLGESHNILQGITNLLKTLSKLNKIKWTLMESNSIHCFSWLASRIHEIIKLMDPLLHCPKSQSISNRLQHIKTECIRAILRDTHMENPEKQLPFLTAFPCEPILIRNLTQYPSVLEDNWEKIMKKILTFQRVNSYCLGFLKKMKSTGYNQLTDKTIKICMDRLEGKKGTVSCLETTNAIKILSLLQNPSQFLQIVIKFYPEVARINIYNDNLEMDYEIKTVLGRFLRFLPPPHAFPAIEQFCLGDYFKLISGSLHSHCSFASEKDTLNFIKNHMNQDGRETIFKQHLVRLFSLLSIPNKQDMLVVTWKALNNNVSIRFELFVQLVRLFLEVGGAQNTWTVLSGIIVTLNWDDRMALSYLQNPKIFENCPTQYLSQYIETSLHALKLFKTGELSECFTGFLAQVKCVMEKVDDNIVDAIVNEFLCYFDNERDFRCCSTESSFYNKYLLTSSTMDKLKFRLNIINVTFTAFIEDEIYQSTYDGLHQTRRASYAFIRFLCQEGITAALLNHNETTTTTNFNVLRTQHIFKELSELLEKLPIFKVFNPLLYIQLASNFLLERLKTGVETEYLYRFGLAVGNMIESKVTSVGGEVIGIFLQILNEFFQDCILERIDCEDDIVEFIRGILDVSMSRCCQILAVSLLPKIPPKSNTRLQTYITVEDKINEADDTVMKIFQGL